MVDDRKFPALPEQTQDRRWDARYPIRMDAQCRHGAASPQRVALADLSVGGCRFSASNARLDPGTFLTLRLGPFGPLDANVMWQDEQSCGVAFSSPLHVAVLDHLRAAAVEREREIHQ